MAKAKVKDFENEEFYQVPKWLVDVKGLQPADILIYMLARNNWKLSKKNGLVTEDGEVYFFLTHDSLKETFDFGRNQIIASLKRLVLCGALIIEKENGKANKYYIENNSSNINFDITSHQINTSLKKDTTHLNQTTPVTKIRLHQSEKSDYHQSEKSDISNTELNKTEVNNNNNTLLDNTSMIDPKNKKQAEQEKNNLENTGAYFQEIKMLLLNHNIKYQSIARLGKPIGRIKSVLKFAKENNKGDGWIVGAIKDDYDLKNSTTESKIIDYGSQVQELNEDTIALYKALGLEGY